MPEPSQSTSRKAGVSPVLFSLFLLLCSGILYLLHLDYWYLWQDEANAALLAKNTLQFGYPYVFDGLNVIWPNVSDVTPRGHYWILWGWLPVYINAFVFAVLGVSTITARLGSSILGILFIQTVYHTLRRSNLQKGTAECTALFLLASIPMTLFIRQCGYYSATLLFGYLMYWCVLIAPGKRVSRVGFLLASTALCNTHILIWGIQLLLVSGIHFIFNGKRKESLQILAGAVVCASPFLLLYQSWILFERAGTPNIIGFYYDTWHQRWLLYAKMFHTAIIPWPVILVVILAAAVIWRSGKVPGRKHFIQAIIYAGTFTALLALITPVTYVRYMLPVISIVLVGVAMACVAGVHRWKLPGGLLTGVCLLGLVIGVAGQGQILPYPLNFLYELRNDSHDVNEILCQYLNQEAKPTDTVLCNYGEFPIAFYTGLAVRGGMGMIGTRMQKTWPDEGILSVANPEWIVVRRDWPLLDEYNRHLSPDDYETVVLPVEDTAWGSRPSPFYHFFITPEVTHPLVIYRLKKSVSTT